MIKDIRYLVTLGMQCLFCASVSAFDVPYAAQAPVVDGDPSDTAWDRPDWVVMDQLMWGSMPEKEDFSGRYKLVWTKDHLYLLAEITDDVLYDSHADPLDAYWEDDALEILIDENASGGNHLYDYNAFAYHIALDNQAADIGPFLSDADREAGVQNRRLYPGHIQSQWKRSAEEPHKIYWEVRIKVFGEDYKDSYDEGEEPAQAVQLYAGKKLGLMLAYCDSDGKAEGGGREHFVGDVVVEPVNGDRNLGYIDASVFGEIILVE